MAPLQIILCDVRKHARVPVVIAELLPVLRDAAHQVGDLAVVALAVARGQDDDVAGRGA
jgi:hypothetical protein